MLHGQNVKTKEHHVSHPQVKGNSTNHEASGKENEK